MCSPYKQRTSALMELRGKMVKNRDSDISMTYQYIDIFKYRIRYDILLYISIYIWYFPPVISYHMLCRLYAVFIFYLFLNSYFFFVNRYLEHKYFDQKYISLLFLFHLLLSYLMSLDQKLKNAHIFVLHNFLYIFR